MKQCKAWIAGVSGTKLTPDEVAFFRDERPWGFILFARNVESLEQVAELTAHMRDVTGRDQTPVFIDQEGGRVQRLRPPLVPIIHPLGRLARSLRATAKRACVPHGCMLVCMPSIC